MNSFDNCKNYEDAFGALLSGDANKEDIRRANEHLEVCSECAKNYSGLEIFRKRFFERYGIDRKKRDSGFQKIFSYSIFAVAAIFIAAASLFMMEIKPQNASEIQIIQTAGVEYDLTTEEEEFILEFVSDDVIRGEMLEDEY